jgi:hypothetical protein
VDFGSRRSRGVQQARDIDIYDLSGDSLRFLPAYDRVSRILRLMRDRNPKNNIPDKLCGLGLTLLLLFGSASLLIWGFVFANATLLLTSWAVLSAVIALPVLTTLYIRQTFGMASPLHRFHSLSLTLTPDRVVLEMKRQMLFRGKHSPTVRKEFLYSRMARLEYDRGCKTLRIYAAGTPAAPMEIVMLYDNSDVLIRELEQRSRIFVHPAMRGDDYADLKDLSGLRKERSLLRPTAVAALLLCLFSLIAALAIRSFNQKNPYMPYPGTREVYLANSFTAGDTITLDGCDFNLAGVTRAASDARGVCYKFILTLHNRNDSAIRIGEHNIRFAALTEEGLTIPLDTAEPPPGYIGVNLPCPARLSAGVNRSVTFFVWIPDNAVRTDLIINSDHWPPADSFRDVTYTGGWVEIGGVMVKSNEARFSLSREGLEF